MTEEEIEAHLTLLALLPQDKHHERRERQVALYLQVRSHLPARATALAQEWWLTPRASGDYLRGYTPDLVERLWQADPELSALLIERSHPHFGQCGAQLWLEKLAPTVTQTESARVSWLLELLHESPRWNRPSHETLQHLASAFPRFDPASLGSLLANFINALPGSLSYSPFDTERLLAQALVAAEHPRITEEERSTIAEAAARHACCNEAEQAYDWSRRLRREIRKHVAQPSGWLKETLTLVRTIALLRNFAHRYRKQRHRKSPCGLVARWQRLCQASLWLEQLPYPWLQERVAKRRVQLLKYTPPTIRLEAARRRGESLEVLIQRNETGVTFTLPKALLESIGLDETEPLRVLASDKGILLETQH